MDRTVEHPSSPRVEAETLFERVWWLYAMCREYLFTDQTEEIAAALAPLLSKPNTHHVLELGCGPGFYSRKLAVRFPHIQITGIDLCEPLLSRARNQANRSQLGNCHFVRADASELCEFPERPDAAIASRLFLILSDRKHTVEKIYQALRPGGLFFVAEPQSRFRAGIPTRLMQLFAYASHTVSRPLELSSCDVLREEQFRELIRSQPWSQVRLWQDRGYQCALCEKPA